MLAGDTAGFPNGRRPGDDVVDIELRVAMGVLLPPEAALSGQSPYTDAVLTSAAEFRTGFPYLTPRCPARPVRSAILLRRNALRSLAPAGGVCSGSGPANACSAPAASVGLCRRKHGSNPQRRVALRRANDSRSRYASWNNRCSARKFPLPAAASSKDGPGRVDSCIRWKSACIRMEVPRVPTH